MTGNYIILLFSQSNKFFKIGQLMGMSICQEGSGFPFLSHTSYKYLSHKDVSSLEITTADVPCPDARYLLEKVAVKSIYSHVSRKPVIFNALLIVK